MAPSNRTVNLPNVWAAAATTTIPGSPSSGTVYRNASADGNAGWAFSTIVSSETFNQYMYETSSIVKAVDQWGIVPWCAATAYAVSALAMGSDGSVYQCIQAGTNHDPTTSPAYWGQWPSPTVIGPWSTTVSGIGKLATDAASIAGTDNVTAITPASMVAAFQSSKAANGYIKLPGGLIFQWATGALQAPPVSTGHGTPTTLNFPITFPNACLSVQVTTAVEDTGDSRDRQGWQVVSFNTTAVVLYLVDFWDANYTRQSKPVIFAIGY
jgi:hypothetical protein